MLAGMTEPIREIIDLTAELIRFRSTASRPEERKACADFIAAWLETNGVGHTRSAVGDVESLAALPEAGRCRVLLMAHFDVVDAPDALFTPMEKDGRLHGRGAIDDKYAVALSMVLMKRQRLRGQGNPLGILLTGDEEVGGKNGAAKALAGLKASFCIALDGGNPGSMIVLEKGVLRLRLTARGKAAHGARPWLGENAIEALMEDLRAVRALFTKDTPDHWHKTLNIGIVQGGTVVNMVPAEAHALLDIRHTENDDPDRLLAEIRAAVKGEVAVSSTSPVFNGGQSSLLDRLRAAAPEAVLDRAHGASDARFLSENGIPGIVWGAEGGGSQHSENEYLVIESLETLYNSLAAFLDGLE